MKSRVDLSNQKAKILSDISTKQLKIDTLISEIALLRDSDKRKATEAKRIEEMLEDKWANFRKEYPIDRSQEKEITDYVSEMDSLLKLKERSYRESCNSIHSSMRRDNFTSFRDPKLTPYKNKFRNAVKGRIDELKNIFDAVDSRTARFYKNGISLSNMDTAGIMVTTSYFSKDARRFQEKIKGRMNFIDYSELMKQILECR